MQLLNGVGAFQALAAIERSSSIIDGVSGAAALYIHQEADPKYVALRDARNEAKRRMDDALSTMRGQVAKNKAYDPFLDEQDDEAADYIALEREYRAANAAFNAYKSEQRATSAPVDEGCGL